MNFTTLLVFRWLCEVQACVTMLQRKECGGQVSCKGWHIRKGQNMQESSEEIESLMLRSRTLYYCLLFLVHCLIWNLANVDTRKRNFVMYTCYRLQEYCEKLMFYCPGDYGRKAEEILWRKVFYEIIQLMKCNKKVSITYLPWLVHFSFCL